MLLRSLVALMALAIAPFAIRAADDDNPYKNAKVGDYVKYTLSTKVGPFAQDGTVTQTVTAVTDKEVTVKATMKIGETEVPIPETKIDLTKPFDPTKAGGGNIPGGGDAKIEKLKEGKEKIKVGGKEYDCVWTTYKFTAKAMGIEIEGDMKAWTSKDVPAGMVKMTMNATFAKNDMVMTMEISEYGNMKKKD